MNLNRSLNRRLLSALAVVMGSLIFAADLFTETSLALTVSYVAVIWLVYAAGSSRGVLLAGGACTALTLLGYVMSPPGEVWQVIVNRGLAVFVLWATALFCLRVLRLHNQQSERTEAAEELTSDLTNQLDENACKSRVMSSIMEDLRRERKRLQASERRFRETVESAPTAMVMINHQGRLELVNAETEKLFGYTRDELLGQPIEILVPDRLRTQHVAHRDLFLAHPEVRQMKTRRNLFGQHKGGQEIPVEIGLNPIETEEGLCVLCAIVDTSEQKKLDKAQRKLNQGLKRWSAELTRSNHELEQFAYVASHDLQEPLRKVVSCCQVLMDDYAEQLDDDARQWLDYAVTGSKRMQSLVADLLKYSRLGRKNIPHVAVDVEAACRTAIENLQFAIEESGAVVNCRRLPRVTADESQLVQLFQNLIGNALKYHGEEPPQIEIGVRDVSWPLEDHPEQHAPSGSQRPGNRRELRGKGRRITFYVRDNGIGIQPQYFDRIFVIFQRLHHKEEYSGTGIGLSICKKIVMQHGGQIRVESTPGKGSTFYFTLPKAKHDGTLCNAVATSASDGELSRASRPGFVNNLQQVRSAET